MILHSFHFVGVDVEEFLSARAKEANVKEVVCSQDAFGMQV